MHIFFIEKENEQKLISRWGPSHYFSQHYSQSLTKNLGFFYYLTLRGVVIRIYGSNLSIKLSLTTSISYRDFLSFHEQKGRAQ